YTRAFQAGHRILPVELSRLVGQENKSRAAAAYDWHAGSAAEREAADRVGKPARRNHPFDAQAPATLHSAGADRSCCRARLRGIQVELSNRKWRAHRRPLGEFQNARTS